VELALVAAAKFAAAMPEVFEVAFSPVETSVMAAIATIRFTKTIRSISPRVGVL
jgi:hypothetical protein